MNKIPQASLSSACTSLDHDVEGGKIQAADQPSFASEIVSIKNNTKEIAFKENYSSNAFSNKVTNDIDNPQHPFSKRFEHFPNKEFYKDRAGSEEKYNKDENLCHPLLEGFKNMPDEDLYQGEKNSREKTNKFERSWYNDRKKLEKTPDKKSAQRREVPKYLLDEVNFMDEVKKVEGKKPGSGRFKCSTLTKAIIGLTVPFSGLATYAFYKSGVSLSNSQETNLKNNFPNMTSTPSALNYTNDINESFVDHPWFHNVTYDTYKNHSRRHVDEKKPETTPASSPEVYAEKNDYSCVEERQSLNVSGVLNVIAETLKSPFEKGAEEWEVFYTYYLKEKGCPKKETLQYYRNLFGYVDRITNSIVSTFPEFLPARILQNLISPLLREIAIYIDCDTIDLKLLYQINSELIALSQTILASLDIPAQNELFSRHAEGAKPFPEGISFNKDGVFAEVNGIKRKLNRERDKTYHYNLNKDGFTLEKKRVNYSSSAKKWVVSDSVHYMYPNSANDSVRPNIHSILLSSARKMLGDKTSSASSFIGKVLVKSGFIKKENYDEIMKSIVHSKPHSEYMNDVVQIKSESQLTDVKAGNILIFTSKGNEGNVQHMMLSLGNGLFTGAQNKIISAEFEITGVVTAEQLGKMAGESFISKDGKSFDLYTGSVKGSNIPFDKNLSASVKKIDKKTYLMGGCGIYAIADALTGTNDISSEFAQTLYERIKNNLPFQYLIKGETGVVEGGRISEEIPVGGIFFLTEGGDDYSKGMFALRVNKNEVLIPSLYEPQVKEAGFSAMYKINEIEARIKRSNLVAKRVAFNTNNARVETLLGKDSRFFVQGDTLHVRAHGLPMTINYLSPKEIASIIKGLAISKKINLDKITTIELESCFGATGYPSTGEIIASILGKKVIAYNGKYSLANVGNEVGRKVYLPTPLSKLESMVADVTEKNIDFIRELRNIFAYLESSPEEPQPSTSRRTKRDASSFNSFLMDIGFFLMGKLDINTLNERNKINYPFSTEQLILISQETQSIKPRSSSEFVEHTIAILSLNDKASDYLNNYLNKIKSSDDIILPPSNDRNVITDEFLVNEVEDNYDNENKVINNIEIHLRLSRENKYLSPSKWSDPGMPGDVYYDDKRGRYYILKKEGLPSYHGWYYPDDAMNNENWLYAGSHAGTLDVPKDWYEYGKVSTVYYEEGRGYFALKSDGRPSDHNWYLPNKGESNERWEFITDRVASFKTPFRWVDEGKKGDVYQEGDDFFILKKDGSPARNYWYYPLNKKDDEYWIYAGQKKGTLDSPKAWNEYGRAGSVYYEEPYGYLELKTEGNPSVNNWYFPFNGRSNDRWLFITQEIGRFEKPKLHTNEGLAGEVYYCPIKKSFYIMRKDGKPLSQGWSFPDDDQDNENWIYAGKNIGTMKSPKRWSEYGKAGSIYYKEGYGYLELKNDGRPSDKSWYFPYIGEVSEHWNHIQRRAGDFTSPNFFVDTGVSGDVYYSEALSSYFVLKEDGNPSESHWHYPADNRDNEWWIYAGKKPGTIKSPKNWSDYGKVGSVYYKKGQGYFILQNEGRPSEYNWYYPDKNQINNNWKFVTSKAGTIETPFDWKDSGSVGDIYYYPKINALFKLEETGNPSCNNWYFPLSKESNKYWTYIGEKQPES